MLTFVPHKTKELSFDVSIEGIDSSFLTAKFTISDKETGISYSVLGKINGDRITFIIPPLNTFILTIKDSYDAKLEITGNKYYLQPWMDSINIFREPIATAKIVDVPDSLEPDVSAVCMANVSLDVEEKPELPIYNYNDGYDGIEEKIKSPERPQQEEKPRKNCQHNIEKKKQMKKIFEE